MIQRNYTATFGQLLYRGRSRWVPLPEWACFLLHVGARVAGSRAEDGRLVVALSLPVRTFAAALAGASAVVTAFVNRPAVSDGNEHFDYLASLPEGTAISHHRANVVQQGRLVGVETDVDDGIPRVRIRLRSGDRCLPVGLSREIQVIDEPGTLKVTRQKLIRDPEFLSRALPGIDVAALSAKTRLDCVLVGVQHALQEELLARQFGTGEGAGIHEGSLQGIVRARDVTGSKDAYRSAIIPATSEEGDPPVSFSTPHVAIFDGARAFSYWRSRWTESNWLVLLDRGAPSAEEGADAVNQAYATRLRESNALAGVEVPPGVEALAYVERR